MSREPKSTGRKVAERLLLLPLFVLVSPLMLLGLILWALNRAVIYLIVWLWWLPNGKDVLYISSDSPIWREYMETEILPLVARRAIILNCSERGTWHSWSFPVRVFRSFGRRREFNPMVVVFGSFKRAKVFRFYPALTKWKHGDSTMLDQLRADLIRAL